MSGLNPAFIGSFFGRLKRPDRFVVLCGLAVSAGIILRFCRLGEALWLDEVLSLNTASLGAAGILKDLAQGPSGANPPLFFLLLAGWMIFFPGTDASLHFFTALIGTLGVGIAWKVSAGLAGRRAGAAAAALLALHPFHIAHSQELRTYGLLVIFTFLSFYFLERALEKDRWRDWLLFSAAGLACLYIHNYAIFLVAAEIAAGAAASFSSPAKRRKLIVAAVIMLAGFAPWIPVVALQAVKPTHAPLHTTTFHDVGLTLRSLFGLYVSAGESAASPLHPGLLFALACSAFAAFCAPVSAGRNRRLLSHMLGITAFSLLAPALISLKIPIYNGGRHSIIALPFVCIIMGWCVSSLKSEKWRIGALGFLLAMQGLTVLFYFHTPKSYNREIAGYLRVVDSPGFEIIIPDFFMKPPVCRYYPPARRARAALMEYPPGEFPDGIITVQIRNKPTDSFRLPGVPAHYREISGKSFGNFALVRVWEKQHMLPGTKKK
ncbi:MAG: glycosyltransferase family 39 protein [bacterium]